MRARYLHVGLCQIWVYSNSKPHRHAHTTLTWVAKSTSHTWQWLTMTLQRTWATADKEWHLHTWHLHIGNCHNWIKAGGTHLPSLIGRLGHYISEYLRTLKRTNNLTSLAQPTWHTNDTVAMARHDEAFLAMSPSSTESVRPPIVHISNVKINANNVQNKNKNDTTCQKTSQ